MNNMKADSQSFAYLAAEILFAVVTFCHVTTIYAQENTPTPLPESDNEPGVAKNVRALPDSPYEVKEDAPPTQDAGTGEASDTDASEIAQLKRRLAQLESKSESDSQKIEALNARLDMEDEKELDALTTRSMDLRIYGYLDIQFYKLFIKEGTFYKGFLPDSSTFTLGHWNLFLEKPLSDHFRMLGEVRFLFQPMGQESDWVGFDREPYGRFDTKATDYVDNYYFNWGGISIQRAYVQYTLNDYFNARVGYYLTPFGIWNEDHASTVILFAHRPFLSTGGHLPEAQLGLYLFGKAFAGDRVSFQYGLTASNGRGPTAEVYDLDENKGLGLTLQATYDGPVYLNAGTYLYMGDCTDIARHIEMPPIDFVETTTVAYSEKVMSFHAQLKWKGLLIQGEYIRRLIEYDGTKRESSDHGQGVYFSPDHIRSGSYELLAYTLPFEKVTITPYVLHEYKDMPSWVEYWAGHSIGGGINWRIIPSVVFKIEGIHNKHRKEQGINSDFQMLITQFAVSY